MNLEKTVLDVREKIIEEKRKRKHMGGEYIFVWDLLCANEEEM